MKLLGAGSFWASVGLHVSVLGALAFWKLAPPPPVALPDISSGGGGQDRAEEQTIHIVRPAPKIVRQPRTNPAFAERRLVVAKPSEIVLPAPEPVVSVPISLPPPSAPAVASQTTSVKKSSGGAMGKKSPGVGSTNGKGRGNGLGDRKASYRQQADLVYPARARSQHQKGVVKVKVYVNSQGRAEQVEVTGSSGFNALDEAALKCARTSSYLPAIRNGSPVSTWVDASFRFQ